MSQNPVPSAPRTADDWQIPTALMTDHYELTMLQAALKAGTAHRRSRFELFTRRLPSGRRYGVVAGVGRALEGLSRFRFDTPELDFLADTTALDDATLAWLADYEFTGDIVGYAEGELLEKWARDSKILDIFEGTQQIQQLIVARRVLGLSSAELK